MKFPALKENEFTVLMADCETGIVLDVNFNRYQNNHTNQNVYSVFADIEQAKEFINRVSEKHDKIEFTLYNSNQEVYEFIIAKFMR